MAGPVVAAACIFPEGLEIDAINDSKQMTEEEREEVYEELMGNPDVIKSVCVIDHNRIDVINILEARGTRRGRATPTHSPQTLPAPHAYPAAAAAAAARLNLSVSLISPPHPPIRAAYLYSEPRVYT